jgi:hypothetical protein
MFFCDPPGTSAPENLFNFGDDVIEENYIFFHDQEPIHTDIHTELFRDVTRRNRDLRHGNGPIDSYLVTSEYNSDEVTSVCDTYGWKPLYYFFHGWASMDWFRGYHRSFLMPEPSSRTITKTFIAPNRIIAGRRNHRLLVLYHIFKNNLTNSWVSCPSVCPAEGINILDAVQPLSSIYKDINDVFGDVHHLLPLEFPNESGSPMHSCWLSLFDECADSLLYLITETVSSGKRWHLTEKSFKPICLRMPFIMVSTQGSLEYLRMYGFRTFGDLWDEGYDWELDDVRRIDRIGKLLTDLHSLSDKERQSLFKSCIPIIEHNYNHFYGGGFEATLWAELQGMLKSIHV